MAKKTKKIKPAIRLNLASGKVIKEGFINVDIRKDVKPGKVVDLLRLWPWATSSVDEVVCENFLHLLTGKQRVFFLDELYRVLKLNPECDPQGSRAMIVTPHWAHNTAYNNPLAQFPPICETSYAFFNRKWREDNGYEDYAIKANFKSPIGWANPHHDYIGRNDELMINHATHSINAVGHLMVTLFKMPVDKLEL